MKTAKVPDDENARLAMLRSYEILDTPPEAAFDEVTRLASTICGTPIALISLVDQDRQWFKSRVGLDAPETHRDLAFCAHAILDPSQPLIVHDTLQDERFFDSPLVLGEPRIRFYAGWPLRAPSGAALGTLCVIGQKPGSLSAEQTETLRVLANQVVSQLELRSALRVSLDRERQIEESRRVLDQTVKMLSVANAELDEFAYAAAHDLRSPLGVIDRAVSRLSTILTGQITDDVLDELRLIRGRTTRMSKLLDDLLEYYRAGNLRDRTTGFVAGDVLMEDILSMLCPPDGFSVTVGNEFSAIRVRRMPLQQVLANLVNNAIKHHDKEAGKIDINVRKLDNRFVFSVKDDGPGIPAQFHETVFKKFQTLKPRDQVEGSGMGLALVRKVADQHGQQVTIESSEGRGCEFRFTWPAEVEESTAAHRGSPDPTR